VNGGEASALRGSRARGWVARSATRRAWFAIAMEASRGAVGYGLIPIGVAVLVVGSQFGCGTAPAGKQQHLGATSAAGQDAGNSDNLKARSGAGGADAGVSGAGGTAGSGRTDAGATAAGKGAAGVAGVAGVGGAAGKSSDIPACTGKKSGELSCGGATLYTCDGLGRSLAQEICASETLCQVSTHAAKCAQCAPESSRCDGSKLLICDKDGQYSVDSGKQYDSPDACDKALQSAGIFCQIGQFKCVGDTVYKCNDARTDFVVDTTLQGPCRAGLCNEQLGKCNVCMPRSVECSADGKAVRTCSDDGQQTVSQACDAASPFCTDGVCGECRMDSDPSKTGCAAGNDCTRSDKQLKCRSSSGEANGLSVEFCHAGACKLMLAAGFDLALSADWTMCAGSPVQAPFAANTVGVMLWPTAITDLAIPLANTGWLCKLPPSNGARNSCVVNASQSSRELYIWGSIESGCTYSWGQTPHGIDATLGAGCGMCTLAKHDSDDSADYAFNMGVDTLCRCPKVHFAATPAKKTM
jgi:hypothetical protein